MVTMGPPGSVAAGGSRLVTARRARRVHGARRLRGSGPLRGPPGVQLTILTAAGLFEGAMLGLAQAAGAPPRVCRGLRQLGLGGGDEPRRRGWPGSSARCPAATRDRCGLRGRSAGSMAAGALFSAAALLCSIGTAQALVLPRNTSVRTRLGGVDRAGLVRRARSLLSRGTTVVARGPVVTGSGSSVGLAGGDGHGRRHGRRHRGRDGAVWSPLRAHRLGTAEAASSCSSLVGHAGRTTAPASSWGRSTTSSTDLAAGLDPRPGERAGDPFRSLDGASVVPVAVGDRAPGSGCGPGDR